MELPASRCLGGDPAVLKRAWVALQAQAVDQELHDPAFQGHPARATTIATPREVTGPGTFFGRASRTLHFRPSSEPGWSFDRTDLPDSLPIGVSVKNVWTTVRNIVLCSGSPHNYMRMVEHIVALRIGMGIDNLAIRMDSGDPPLFDRSSMDLVETLEQAGIVETDLPAAHVTVREPVSIVGPHGNFLLVLPAKDGDRGLHVDCAIDFKSAIGRQRIRFTVSPAVFRHGAAARTNTTLGMMLYCKTIGQLFADTRNLGYTMRNIQVAGRWRYVNRPGLIHNGKSLEAAWHRATLDLLAAVALIDRGRFCGTIYSYKAGHAMDCQFVRELYQRDLLVAC